MIKKVNVFNTPSAFSFQETIMQNSNIISSLIPTSNDYYINTKQPSKINWWWIGCAAIIALGVFVGYFFWEENEKAKKLAEITEEKAKNAREQNTQERFNDTVNSYPINAFVKNQQSQNNGYLSSDNSQEDDIVSRLFKK